LACKVACKAKVFWSHFNNKQEAVGRLLDAAGLASFLTSGHFKSKTFVLIKPNLVNESPFPVTTPDWIVRKLVSYIRSINSNIQIVLAEGTGQPEKNTLEMFIHHGYTTIRGVDFVDLNEEDCVAVPLPRGKKWQTLYIPAILQEAFLISVPVLKAHTLAGVTLSMKNMIGVCPPKFYQSDGFWRKSAFHSRIHEAIFDLNMARKPDFCLLDATVGLSQSHLSGPTCNPPINKILAGSDPVAIDAFGAKLLSKKWQEIGHIKMANNHVGQADAEIIKIPV